MMNALDDVSAHLQLDDDGGGKGNPGGVQVGKSTGWSPPWRSRSSSRFSWALRRLIDRIVALRWGCNIQAWCLGGRRSRLKGIAKIRPKGAGLAALWRITGREGWDDRDWRARQRRADGSSGDRPNCLVHLLAACVFAQERSISVLVGEQQPLVTA